MNEQDRSGIMVEEPSVARQETSLTSPEQEYRDKIAELTRFNPDIAVLTKLKDEAFGRLSKAIDFAREVLVAPEFDGKQEMWSEAWDLVLKIRYEECEPLDDLHIGAIDQTIANLQVKSRIAGFSVQQRHYAREARRLREFRK